MALPETVQLQQLEATKAQTAATLAAAIVAAANRPFSIEEVLDISRSIQFALYPARGNGRYEEWYKTADESLKKVRS